MPAWKDKSLYLTGASSGIGLAISKHALANGAKVSALVRTINPSLQALQKQGLHISLGDVTNRRDVADWIAAGQQTIGNMDIVINNAGLMYYMDILKPDYEQMKNMLEVNCLGFINLLDASLAALQKAKHPHWINISSDAGKQPFPGLAIYSGTKAFVEFSTKAMRQELIQANIKLTNIQPGNVDTPLHQKSTHQQAIEQYASSNQGQYLNAEDIVAAIDYAISTPHAVAVNEILIEPLTESI